VQHSKRMDSFCEEDEHFFDSYEAERVSGEAFLTFEFDTAEARPPTTDQLAHFTRFRRPVAWLIAAMGSLSLVALGHSLQRSPRHEPVVHSSSARAIRATARTSETPWSWTELTDSALALVLESTQPGTSGNCQPSPDYAAKQANLVNEFTSSLLCMCRDAPTQHYQERVAEPMPVPSTASRRSSRASSLSPLED
jgi:hypothetical protein